MKESVFLTGYDQDNILISKKQNILGWKQNSRKKQIAKGDYIFIYDTTNKIIECLFQIDSVNQTNDLIWKDELKSNEYIYKNRWNAHLVLEKLDIKIDDILNTYPFNKHSDTFYKLIRNPFPNYLDEKYHDFRSLLLTKSKINGSQNENNIFNKNVVQYYLIQVSETGRPYVLNNHTYGNKLWKNNRRNYDHGKVKKGDILLVYFTGNSTSYKQELKKIYRVDTVSPDNVTFSLEELYDIEGISLSKIKDEIKNGSLSKSFLNLGQQGFNIVQIPESDYNTILNFAQKINHSNAEFISIVDLITYIEHQSINPNYQFVVIKTLIENNDTVSKQEIQNQLYIYNPDANNNSITDSVLSRLVKNGIIKNLPNRYILNLKNPLNNEQKNSITKLCNIKIKESLNKSYTIKFWKIAPGENASLWIENVNNGIIAIGWNEIGVLTNKSPNTLHNVIKKKFPDNYSSIFSQFEDFISIKPNDIIIANKGYSKIVGIGKVTGSYQFRPDLSFHHTYPVEWYQTKEKDIPSQIGKWRRTISSVSPELYHELILSMNEEYEKVTPSSVKYNEHSESINHSLTELKSFENDQKLLILTQEEIDFGYNQISNFLLISKEKIIEILTALSSGRHVLLAGPIGTGKTELARKIPEVFWKENGGVGYIAEVHTATADWSTHEVIGGIMPKMKDEKIVYEFQYGCALDTIQKNWEFGVNGGSRVGSDIHKGVWLVIDEFNRADIDKAFGQLFTALRTRSLKIPLSNGNSSYREIKVPSDYRIICTLNTADKHFLFRLSDALKSRFAYIEIDTPGKEKQNQEIYYAIKNAIIEIGVDSIKSNIDLDDNKKIIKESTNQDLYNALYQAYNFIELIRLFKKLGTAILQLLYQNIVVGNKFTNNLDQSLDNALTSTLIPQIESLSGVEIGTIAAICNDKLVKFFQDKYKSPHQQLYSQAFSTVVEYLNVQNYQQLSFNFSKGILNIEDINQISPAYEKIKNTFNSNLIYFKESINDLVKSSLE